MNGLGKYRTAFGIWMDNSPYSQKEFANKAEVSRETISKACSNDDFSPSRIIMRKIQKTAQEVDPTFRAERYWPL